MRRTAPVVGTLLALASVPLASSSAQAACAPPVLRVSETLVDAGQDVTVKGARFVATCNETGPPGAPMPAADPATVEVVFVQDGRTKQVARVTADAKHRFTVVVRIPRWAEPGDATLRAAGANQLALTVADDSDPFRDLDRQEPPATEGGGDSTVVPTSTTLDDVDAAGPTGEDDSAGSTGGDVDEMSTDGGGDGGSDGGKNGEGRLSETGPAGTTMSAGVALVLLVLGSAAVRGAELAGREVRWYVRPDGTRRRRRVRP